MDKQAQLDQIKADILDKNVCPDLAKTATQLVFGDGSAESEVVFIGEAPGKNEDEQGIPFVGAAVKFLNEMLASIHLKREQIYITNIVKYRPPNNRDPLPEEKQAFMPFLMRQIQVINPKLVVCLGRHSGMAFLPDLKISQDHGQPKKVALVMDDDSVKKYVILPLYHPAAALYNGGQRQTLLDDFSLIPIILDKIRKE